MLSGGIITHTLIIKPGIRDIISNLAQQLQTTEEMVVQQAIMEYAEKLKKKKKLMSFAGILEENEADELLKVIRLNRIN